MFSDTYFPIAPILEQLHAGVIYPAEAAQHIRQPRTSGSAPVWMPPDDFFAALPEKEREKAREVWRILADNGTA